MCIWLEVDYMDVLHHIATTIFLWLQVTRRYGAHIACTFGRQAHTHTHTTITPINIVLQAKYQYIYKENAGVDAGMYVASVLLSHTALTPRSTLLHC